MKNQLPFGSGSRGICGRAVVAAGVEWGVSGQGDDSAIRGEGFAEDGVASRQGWAGLLVSARLCVVNNYLGGANIARV